MSSAAPSLRFSRPNWTGVAGGVLPFLVALAVGAVLLLVTGRNPLDVYGLMVREGFGGGSRIAATLTAATPILFTAVATAISFRAGIFNVGIEGAFYLGGLSGAVIGFTFVSLSSPLLISLELAGGALIGAAWLTLPAMLRARLEIDEVVSTLMLNFVAVNLTLLLVNGPFLAPGSANSATPLIAEAGWLPRVMPPATLTVGFFIALALLASYWVWDSRTPLGFEARLNGVNPRFSRAIGIDVPKLILEDHGLVGGDRRPGGQRPCARRHPSLRRRLLAWLWLDRIGGGLDGTQLGARHAGRFDRLRRAGLGRNNGTASSATFLSKLSTCCRAS